MLAIEDTDPINIVAEEHLETADQAAAGVPEEEVTTVAADQNITLLSQFVEEKGLTIAPRFSWSLRCQLSPCDDPFNGPCPNMALHV